MKPLNQHIDVQEISMFQQIFYKFLPYWYVFLLLLVISISLAFVYLSAAPPLYESHASILVKDQKRGQEESKMEDALNVLVRKISLKMKLKLFVPMPYSMKLWIIYI